MYDMPLITHPRALPTIPRSEPVRRRGTLYPRPSPTVSLPPAYTLPQPLALPCIYETSRMSVATSIWNSRSR
ncbi:hypothetical protein C8Q79DRAFT_723479 [Trametes meyenii]|nr:hypothetical protein C8Q79DRAFT_723479 [Trametes meyenii]